MSHFLAKHPTAIVNCIHFKSSQNGPKIIRLLLTYQGWVWILNTFGSINTAQSVIWDSLDQVMIICPMNCIMTERKALVGSWLLIGTFLYNTWSQSNTKNLFCKDIICPNVLLVCILVSDIPKNSLITARIFRQKLVSRIKIFFVGGLRFMLSFYLRVNIFATWIWLFFENTILQFSQCYWSRWMHTHNICWGCHNIVKIIGPFRS